MLLVTFLPVACALSGRAQEGVDLTNLTNLLNIGHAASPSLGLGSAKLGYNIQAANCHTAANSFAANAAAQGAQGGILKCKGDPEINPGYHTASWFVMPSERTCILNWGNYCCWDAAASPPDLGSGEGLRCAKQACGDQYDPQQTEALPPGKLVETPGPQTCSIIAAGGPPSLLKGPAVDALTDHLRRVQADPAAVKNDEVQVRPHAGNPAGAKLFFNPDRLQPCMTCCDQRANMWDTWAEKKHPAPVKYAGQKQQYLARCQTTCRNSFPQEKSQAQH